MRALKKSIALACVCFTMGATAAIFVAPADGSAKFRYCNKVADGHASANSRCA